MHYIGQPICLLKPVRTMHYAAAASGSEQIVPAGTVGTIFYVPTRLGCSILKGVFVLPGLFSGSPQGGCDWIAPIDKADFEVLEEAGLCS